MKLYLKVPLLIILILLVLFSISTGFLLYHQREDTLFHFRNTAQILATVIQDSLEQSMLTGEREHVQEALVLTAKNESIHKVTIYLPDGVIAASSKIDEIGTTASTTDNAPTFLNNEPSMEFNNQYGNHLLEAFTPILNKTACQGCHAEGQATLGIIEVSLDTTKLFHQLRQDTIFIIILGLTTFILLGVGLALMLRKTMLNRLSALAGTAQKLSEGSYASRSAITGKDEIGVLADTFNKMAANVEQRNFELKQSRQQLIELNSNLEEKVQERTRELATMNTLLGTLNRSLDPNQMLEYVLHSVATLVDAKAGTVHVFDDTGKNLTRVAEIGLSSTLKAEAFRTKTDEIAREVVQSEKLVEYNGNGVKTEDHNFIGFPLGSTATLGVLTLANDGKEIFQPEKIRLVAAFCDAIGIAMENARASQSIKEANKIREYLLEKLISAQEEERRRIARELHDEASQSLAALAFNLQDIAESIPEQYQELRDRMSVLKERAVTTLTGVRDLALQLRPSALDDLGLVSAIDWYAKDLLRKRNIEVKVLSSGEKVKLPFYTETMLFRVVQEALTNIVKHAEATRVGIEIVFAESSLTLKIGDNGKGFDVEAILAKKGARQNLGIHGMIERVTLLGGTLSFHSEHGQGTIFQVEVPFGRDSGNDKKDTGFSG